MSNHTLPLGERIQSIEPSPTLTITALANSLKAQGKDIISFSAGQPDFDTPTHIKDAAHKALDDGHTGYEAVAGIKALREAIAQQYNDKGFHVGPDNIVVSVGAKHSLYECTQVLLNPGDEVIIPAPYWVSYPAQVKLAGATPIIITATEASNFKITADQLRAAITPKTRLLVLNSPSNPTGAVYSKTELEAIADVVLEHKIGVLYDAIYEQLVYGDEPFCEFATLRPGLEDLTITVNGLSKSHAMTGWRVGYIVAPVHVAKAVSKLQSQSTSCITSFVQYAAVAAITGTQEPTKIMRGHFDRRRKLMIKKLATIENVTCAEPTGAFYAFPNFSAYLGKTGPDGVINNDLDLASFLLKHQGVACVPGSAFGAPGCLRMSYATDDTSIEKGLDRIAAGLAQLT